MESTGAKVILLKDPSLNAHRNGGTVTAPVDNKQFVDFKSVIPKSRFAYFVPFRIGAT